MNTPTAVPPGVVDRLRDIVFKVSNTAVPVVFTGLIAILSDPSTAGDLWWAPMAVLGLNAGWAWLRQSFGNYVPPPAQAVASTRLETEVRPVPHRH